MKTTFSNIVKILSGDLDWWSQVKSHVQTQESIVYFKSGEIWWCKVGLNVGEEIFGKGIDLARPVLILRKLTGNSFMALPLTSQKKLGTWYVEISLNNTKRWAMLNQARILDKKRLMRRIGTLDVACFVETRRRFVEFYSS